MHMHMQDQISNQVVTESLPDPRGRKSLPTTLSKTGDFPELCLYENKKYKNYLLLQELKIKFKFKKPTRERTWPPTTATDGRASQRDMPSPRRELCRLFEFCLPDRSSSPL